MPHAGASAARSRRPRDEVRSDGSAYLAEDAGLAADHASPAPPRLVTTDRPRPATPRPVAAPRTAKPRPVPAERPASNDRSASADRPRRAAPRLVGGRGSRDAAPLRNAARDVSAPLRDAPQDVSAPIRGGIPGRRTITIQGRGAERYTPARPRRHRQRSLHERTGMRPDRAAMWAVLLGVLLILAAATSSHAAVIRAHVALTHAAPAVASAPAAPSR